MMYARLPDGFGFDARVIAAGNAAVGALTRMSAWAAGNASDGFVPDAVVRMIGTPREITGLEDCGLVERVIAGEKRLSVQRVGGKDDVLVVFPADGVWLSDYLTWNLSAAEGRELSERGRKGGRASAAARAARQAQPQAERGVQLDVEPHVNLPSSSPVQSGPVQSKDLSPTEDWNDQGASNPDSPLAAHASRMRVSAPSGASAAREVEDDRFARIAEREGTP